jgi:NAD(P)-dependent dehydrogenase (short-subunit alcohol dehydrogenase family)
MILKNKVIIVTGGSGLIGKSIINEIKLEGGIAINLDFNVKTDIQNHSYFFDVTDKNLEINLKKILSNHKKIDGLVNSAYPKTKDWGEKLENVSKESFQINVDWQMNSVFSIVKTVVEKMKNNKGSIVSLASIYGSFGNDFNLYQNTNLNPPVAYSAIKGGLINMNRYLASYFAKNNIRFNCVSPGGIFNNQNMNFVENYNRKVPMGRMGSPEDISPAVVFLLSNKSSYITGQNITIDGGWTVI